MNTGGDAYPWKMTDGSLSKPTSTTGGKMLSIPKSDRYYEIVISTGKYLSPLVGYLSP
jgi:hypothetical protein